MVLEYIFLDNSRSKHNFYSTYHFFAVKKYLEENKAKVNEI